MALLRATQPSPYSLESSNRSGHGAAEQLPFPIFPWANSFCSSSTAQTCSNISTILHTLSRANGVCCSRWTSCSPLFRIQRATRHLLSEAECKSKLQLSLIAYNGSLKMLDALEVLARPAIQVHPSKLSSTQAYQEANCDWRFIM